MPGPAARPVLRAAVPQLQGHVNRGSPEHGPGEPWAARPSRGHMRKLREHFRGLDVHQRLQIGSKGTPPWYRATSRPNPTHRTTVPSPWPTCGVVDHPASLETLSLRHSPSSFPHPFTIHHPLSCVRVCAPRCPPPHITFQSPTGAIAGNRVDAGRTLQRTACKKNGACCAAYQAGSLISWSCVEYVLHGLDAIDNRRRALQPL